MTTIFRARQKVYKQPLPETTWALSALPGQQRTLTAYMWSPQAIISFTLVDGQWHVMRSLQADPAGCFMGCIALDGKALIICHEAEAAGSFLSHFDLQKAMSHTIAPDVAKLDLPWRAKPFWAPFLKAWPLLYAYIHTPTNQLAKRTGAYQGASEQSVRLVNACTHKLLGSWSVTDLKVRHKQTMGKAVDEPQEDPEGIELCHIQWAPSGLYLAVFCNIDWVWILSFDDQAEA